LLKDSELRVVELHGISRDECDKLGAAKEHGIVLPIRKGFLNYEWISGAPILR
jgi:hypothetical protein